MLWILSSDLRFAKTVCTLHNKSILKDIQFFNSNTWIRPTNLNASGDRDDRKHTSKYWTTEMSPFMIHKTAKMIRERTKLRIQMQEQLFLTMLKVCYKSNKPKILQLNLQIINDEKKAQKNIRSLPTTMHKTKLTRQLINVVYTHLWNWRNITEKWTRRLQCRKEEKSEKF